MKEKILKTLEPGVNNNTETLENGLNVNGSNEEGNTAGKTGNIFGQEITCDILKGEIQGCLIELYYNSIYWVSGLLIRLGAGLMDAFMAISLSATIYKNGFIETGWTLVRDVCNIFFIFILLYTAFKMVIGSSHFNANKIIVNVVIIGLLINFSLFFSKVIIDMGNISARVFYNQIRVTASDAASENNDMSQKDQEDALAKGLSTSDIKPKSITEALANGLNLTKVQNEGYSKMTQEGQDTHYGVIWLLLLLATAINVIATWIFVKVSFAFLGRVLTLWVGMIMSPFAFTSTIIPGGGH
jgi:hypothetical protein